MISITYNWIEKFRFFFRIWIWQVEKGGYEKQKYKSACQYWGSVILCVWFVYQPLRSGLRRGVRWRVAAEARRGRAGRGRRGSAWARRRPASPLHLHPRHTETPVQSPVPGTEEPALRHLVEQYRLKMVLLKKKQKKKRSRKKKTSALLPT